MQENYSLISSSTKSTKCSLICILTQKSMHSQHLLAYLPQIFRSFGASNFARSISMRWKLWCPTRWGAKPQTVVVHGISKPLLADSDNGLELSNNLVWEKTSRQIGWRVYGTKARTFRCVELVFAIPMTARGRDACWTTCVATIWYLYPKSIVIMYTWTVEGGL